MRIIAQRRSGIEVAGVANASVWSNDSVEIADAGPVLQLTWHDAAGVNPAVQVDLVDLVPAIAGMSPAHDVEADPLAVERHAGPGAKHTARIVLARQDGVPHRDRRPDARKPARIQLIRIKRAAERYPVARRHAVDEGLKSRRHWHRTATQERLRAPRSNNEGSRDCGYPADQQLSARDE